MVLVVGYQLTFAIFYISDRAEAVVLQFKDVVGIIKRALQRAGDA